VIGKSFVDKADCITDPGVVVANALVFQLGDFGGPTKTNALAPGSPAVDATSDCVLAEDQRHVARPKGLGCDPGAYEFNDYLQTPITIDPSVAVNPSTGVAIVTGTVTCGSVDLTLEVELSQPQKSGRATVTAKAGGFVNLSCTGVKAWSISLLPQTGAFINGPGTVVAKTQPPAPFYAQATAEAAVKLYWGRK